MSTETHKEFNRLLESLADSLDIHEDLFKEAEDLCRAVGRWLGQEGSPLFRYGPEIYLQGSFLLGTVIKPKSGRDEYDIDLVCQLDLKRRNITNKKFAFTLVSNILGHQLCHISVTQNMNYVTHFICLRISSLPL